MPARAHTQRQFFPQLHFVWSELEQRMCSLCRYYYLAMQ